MFNDDGFSAPSPSDPSPNGPSGGPVGSNPGLSGGLWQRNLIIGLVVLILVGGAVFYFLEEKGGDKSSDYIDYYSDDGDVYSEISPDDDYGFEASSYWGDYDNSPSYLEGYMTFVQYDEGYMIDYPEGWELDTESTLVSGAFYSPYEDTEDIFQESVNVTTEDLSWYGPITLEEYGEAALSEIELSFPEYTFIESGVRTVGYGTFDAGYLLGSYDVEGLSLRIYSFYVIEGETAYVITYTFELEKEELYRETVEEVLNSFWVLVY